MPKKSAVKPVEQVLNTNLVNKNGLSAGSNAVDSVNISKIRCHVCSQVRPATEYSNRQLQRHQNTIFNPYIPGGRSVKDYATCKRCTASQTEEIKCFHCGEVKPLKKFLKTQRSQAKPRCKGCVQYCLDTERNQKTPHLDDYTYDSSDDSDVDDIYGIRRVAEDNGDIAEVSGEDEDSDEEDVDAPKEKQESKARAPTPSLIDNMTSMIIGETPPAGRTVATSASRVLPTTPHLLDDDDSGWQQVPVTRKTNSALRTPTYASLVASAPATSVLGTTSATPNQPSRVSNTPHLLDDDEGWQEVRVAGKTNSAFRTPSYASRAASGLATPTMTPTTYSISSRTSTSTPATTPGTSSAGTSTTGGRWGKPAKPNAGEVVEDVWKTKTARRNNWTSFGGQPKMVVPKQRKRGDSDDDDDNDDDDDYE